MVRPGERGVMSEGDVRDVWTGERTGSGKRVYSLLTRGEQIDVARDWLAGAYSPRARGWTDSMVEMVTNRAYPGGWDAFVAECCVYVLMSDG
jgi:hypothetical protein